MSTTPLPPIAKPPAPNASLYDILNGPSMDPLKRVASFSDDEFEAFIEEWAYEYLQELSGKYIQVSRYGGAGDKGRDIVCYKSLNPVKCDVFQCKRYGDPLAPSDAWIELAKLCYNTHKKLIPLPAEYRFVAPHNVGPKLGSLLEDPIKLRSELITQWQNTTVKQPLCSQLISGQKIELKGSLLTYVQKFDFSIVQSKPMHEVVAEFRKTSRYAARFGGGLTKPFPPDKLPPSAPTADELVYVEALLDAYRDHLKLPTLDVSTLPTNLARHYERSRERFYCAETIREFAKDSLPQPFTYEDVTNSVYDAVVEIEQKPWPCGYTRVNEVITAAGLLTITNSPLSGFLKPKSYQGVCHQLANAKRLKWVH
ncbi:MAG: hypothetical protein JNK90_07405 [Planctomycetaceae bacterium]|nr:hypothetical protein [Planctomycetaceae bacterium]